MLPAAFIRINRLRRRLRAAGIPPKRTRRARKFRQRRERRAAASMLLQVDASRHDWLQGRGPHLTHGCAVHVEALQCRELVEV